MNAGKKIFLGAIGIFVLAVAVQAADKQRERAPAVQPEERIAMTAGAAQVECFDFSNVPMDTRYHVGDTINAEHATIELREFWVDRNTPSQLDENGGEQQAHVQSSSQAQGSAPELRMVMINAHVTPNAPVRKVELKFAENTGGAGPISNLEVNGRKRVVDGGLGNANGKVLGNDAVGKAAVIVNYDTLAQGIGFNRGTLRLHATKGDIESWSVGGSSQFFIDEVCMTKS